MQDRKECHCSILSFEIIKSLPLNKYKNRFNILLLELWREVIREFKFFSNESEVIATLRIT